MSFDFQTFQPKNINDNRKMSDLLKEEIIKSNKDEDDELDEWYGF